MNMHKIIKFQNILIENKQLKDEVARLKKLVFQTDNEKDLVAYSIVLLCSRLVDEIEIEDDYEKRIKSLTELEKLANILNSFK